MEQEQLIGFTKAIGSITNQNFREIVATEVTRGSRNFYSIVAPGTIQPNHDYSVSVTLHENSESATIKVGIVGSSYNEKQTIGVSPSQTAVVTFKVPKLKNDNYKLEAEGIAGLIFKKSKELIFRNNEPKVYIQTDKATYKPGDLVRYRILVLDEETRPAKLELPLRLCLKDGAGNIVKQENDIKLTKGVHSGKFQLLEQPILGDWALQVSLSPNVDDSKTEKKFEVAKHVLPKFSVDIETLKDISYADPLKITVHSKYTYGKPIKGQATIKVDAKNGQAQSEKIIEVDGKGHVEFDLSKDLDINALPAGSDFGSFAYQFTPPINISVIMTDEYTGNKQYKTAHINLHYSRYIIDVPTKVYDYVAKKPFEYKVFVKYLDGSPVHDGKHTAQLTTNNNNGIFGGLDGTIKNDQSIFITELDENGMGVFKITFPTATYYHAVKVTYDDRTQYLPNLLGREEKIDSNEGTENPESKGDEDVGPLKLVQKTDKLQLHEDVTVEVKSNKNIPYYIYGIVSRGDIIKQEHVKLFENVTSDEIKFKPTLQMVPESHLYVYFMRDGDWQFQEMALTFPQEHQNKIEITAPEQAKPSEEVTLLIKSDPYSVVGLLGVDQSVLLLRTGNDLDSSTINNNLSSWSTKTLDTGFYDEDPDRSSGLVILTNANYTYSTKRERSWIAPFLRRPVTAKESNIQRFGMVQPQTAMSGLPSSAAPIALTSSAIEPKIRKEFIENWIFNDLIITDGTGMATLTKNIPDTITSWVVTGFSLNEKTGFGMVANSTNIQVFQPFFIGINLPYSVKRGEIISIPILVFNYIDKNLDAEVTMENTDEEYDFIEVSNEIHELVLEEKQRMKRVTVPPNSDKIVSFMIRPIKVGEITLKIKSLTPLAGDAIHQKLKVEAEGVTQYENQAIFIIPSATKEPIKETLKAVIPKEAVLDSEYLEFSVVADILGPTFKNIDKFVSKPNGFGAENVINFQQNMLVLHYLDAVKREMPTVVDKAKNFMEVGYQRELTYRDKDGAYCPFGVDKSDPNSWLTAYVARSFIQAKRYIPIDQHIIDNAVKYLVSNQLESGQFDQTGDSIHALHDNDLGFTAFALLALLEDENISKKYKTQIEKGLKYLTQSIDEENDTYALAIALVVLKRTQHASAEKLMAKLEKLAKEENNLKWWSNSSQYANNDNEITSYVLEAYVYTEPAVKLTPIIKWLIKNRNETGGLDSIQDLQALVRFAEKYIVAGDGKLTIKYGAQDSDGNEITKGSFSIDNENSLILQTHVLPKSTRQISMEAEGKDSFLVELSYCYNLACKDNKYSFSIKYTILDTPYSNMLKMTVCADYVPGTDSETKQSNMAVMEVYLPSGFTTNNDKLDCIRQIKQVHRVETKNSDTIIIIYFDYLEAGKKVCLEVNAEKTHDMAKQKPAAITIYDYYNLEQRATVYYEVK